MVSLLTWVMIILDLILIGVIALEVKKKPGPFQVKDYIVYILIILASFVALYFLHSK